jgi:hypothetical protein
MLLEDIWAGRPFAWPSSQDRRDLREIVRCLIVIVAKIDEELDRLVAALKSSPVEKGVGIER